MSDEQAANWWNELKVHNIIIRHPTQTQRGIRSFTEEKQEYQRQSKQSIICK